MPGVSEDQLRLWQERMQKRLEDERKKEEQRVEQERQAYLKRTGRKETKP